MNKLPELSAAACFSDYVSDFIDSRRWEQAGFEVRIAHHSLTMHGLWLSDKGIVVRTVSSYEDGLPKWGDDVIGDKAASAACLLRDHLLQTTGQRIYGLSFTLYPDGKFSLDYDYERPADYDDSEDTISLDEALSSLGQAGIAANPGDNDTSEGRFLAAAMRRLQALTDEHTQRWGLGSETRWNLDMNAGTLQLSFADGRELVFPVQIVGTYNTDNGSFLWGWDHPSVPEPLRRAAKHLYDYGKQHDIARLTTKVIQCSEQEAWEFTAAAADLDGVTGAYRGNSDGTWVYMTFSS